MKVCVGLSGGVDSSVAALLLKRQGYDVFAMFMQNWHDADATLHGDCEWEEDRFVAEIVARKIGIPFYFVDLSKEYRPRVVDYMFNEYSAGRTPNPDILCNREIKFDAFFEAACENKAKVESSRLYTAAEQIRNLFYRAKIETSYRGMRLGIHAATEICTELCESLKDYTAANAAYVRNTLAQIIA